MFLWVVSSIQHIQVQNTSLVALTNSAYPSYIFYLLNPIQLQMKLLLILALLMLLVDAVNVRSFRNQIETSTFSKKDQNGNSNTSPTVTIIFQTAKTNTIYRYAISVQLLALEYKSDDCAVLLTVPYGLTNSQMKVDITSIKFNTISNNKFRYLVVQSYFTYLTTAHFSFSDPAGYQLFSGSPINQLVTLPSSMAVNSLVMSFINGWNIIQNMNKQISVFSSATMVDASTVNVLISSTLPIYCTLFSLTVDILVYDRVAFQAAYNNQLFASGSKDTTISATLHTFAFNINEFAYFVGLSCLYMSNPGQDAISFQLQQLVANADITIQTTPNVQHIFVNFIQLQTEPNCTAPTFWSQSTNDCISCPTGTYLETTPTSCKSCDQEIKYCIDCTSKTVCNTCGYRLTFTTGKCEPVCYFPQCTSCSFSLSTGVICTSCSIGYVVSAQDGTLCTTVCGDGIVMMSEQCDDGNNIDDDGCSATCTVEQLFVCSNTTNSPSLCQLQQMSIQAVCIIKNQDSNSFTLVLQLYPNKLSFYPTIDWSAGVQSHPHFSILSANYDSKDLKLRLTFTYSSSIQDMTNLFILSPGQISARLSPITDKIITLPQYTQNNQSLQFFDESIYAIAKAVRYLGYIIASLSIILYLAGYFGTKLISIEGIAVVQLAAMLVFSLKNTNPLMAALQPLSMSMGLTCLPKDYKYESSNLSPHMKLLMLSNNIFDCQNIFYVFLLFPLLLGLVLKLLSQYKYKNKPLVRFAWKNSVGTFTFYAILLLAYGQISYFVGSAKYFSSQTNSYIAIVVTLLFILLMAVYVVGFIKYPRWFGSFKNKFQKFNIAEYFYLIATTERIITPILIVASSPFPYASLIVFPIFVVEAVFIAYKKPYLLETWKRPLANKIIAAIICILFTIAAATSNHSNAQIVITILIELILLTVLSYSAYFTIKHLPQNVQSVKFKMANSDTVMELKDCQKKQLDDFAAKMLPHQYAQAQEMIEDEYGQGDKSKYKGYWQNYYCQLYTGSILQNILNSQRMNKQNPVEMKELDTIKDIIKKQ